MSDDMSGASDGASKPVSMLDAGTLPVRELAELARRESHRPRPVYTAHKWFARRYGTAMRALLVASQVTDESDFWPAFYSPDLLAGKTVVDIFAGGGTSLYEASRLGAAVVGADIDPVACAVTEFELRARELPDPFDIFDDVYAAAEPLRSLYRTVGPDGDDRDGVHFFYVQRIACGACKAEFDAHPTFQLALIGDQQWVVCSDDLCGNLHLIDASQDSFRCDCGLSTRIAAGRLNRGKATCPVCGHAESLINYARRTGERPDFRLFAIESIPIESGSRPAPIVARTFHKPTRYDLDRVAVAAALLAERSSIPDRPIPVAGRSDSRILGYNYVRYRQLFSDRQLLHADWLLKKVAGLPAEHRLSYALALSNHLVSNCLLTRYSARWRQVTPLFSLRAFAHSARPVELNPWLRGTGRGTFPNALRRVANAIAFANNPKEYTLEPGGFQPVPAASSAPARVLQQDSRRLPTVDDGVADIVLTDPPYLDNIDYSELSDFFVPWLAAAGVIRDPGGPSEKSLAAKGRLEAHGTSFMEGIADCFREAARILKPDGRLVFTFQHQSTTAWNALAEALAAAGFHPVTVMPLRGDSDMSLHRRDGSSTWDAVFVLAKHPHPFPTDAEAAVDSASLLADEIGLEGPDRQNLQRAYLAGAEVARNAQPAPV